MVSNVLPRGGHLNDISSFSICVLWIFVSRRMINLPILILHHMLRCRIEGRSGLPYVQMLTSILVKKWRSFHRYCGEILVQIVSLDPIEPRLGNRSAEKSRIVPNSPNNVEEYEELGEKGS